MNFFQQQEKAKKKTLLLVLLFILAVLSLVALTTLVISATLVFVPNDANSVTITQPTFDQILFSPMSQAIAGLVTLTVLLASVYKWIQLSSGGKAVAESLGGRLISPDTNNPIERKALNVVEEMAIASGNTVPPVYLLEDTSINAFAAGFTRRDAVIGLTKGCITLLDRDELQGVVAHEFSHIHNGDMKLNMRLISILHGILIIGIIGYTIARPGHYSSHRSSKGNSIALLGFALMAIGYCGTFFGNMIKAAVSRQREFLADASAVQFTRNPMGICGALKKIGGLKQGSFLSSGHASEFSHMYFGQGIRTKMNALMATHPPLINRIKRIEPRWDGRYQETSFTEKHEQELQAQKVEPSKVLDDVHQKFGFVEQATEFIGDPQPHHKVAAKVLLSAIPQDLHSLAHNAFSARAIVYAMLLSDDNEIHNQQLQHLKQNAHPITVRELHKCVNAVIKLPRALNLTLIELCLPSLKQLSQPQYDVFKKNILALIKADKKISMLEWCLYRIITQNCENIKHEPKLNLNNLHEDISVLFSLVVYAGKSVSQGNAFKAGIDSLGIKKVSFKLSDEKFSLKRVDQALENLCQIKPLQKPRLLKAIARIINADNQVTIEEAELYRAIGDSLDCPIPPIVV